MKLKKQIPHSPAGRKTSDFQLIPLIRAQGRSGEHHLNPCIINVWVNSKGAHAPPVWTLGIWHFLFFLVKFPTMWALSLVKCPLPRDFLGVKCPAPRAEVTEPRLISGILNEIFNTAISIIFCIAIQRLRSSFFFCVHSDHLGSRYELSAFRTLQSFVSRQEEVQEHESVHSKFCNSRVFSEGLLSSGFNFWQRRKSFVKCT